MQEAAVMEEETLFVDEMPTATNGSRRHRDEKGELDDKANVDGSAMGVEMTGDAQGFEDATSYRISDDDNISVDSIQAGASGTASQAARIIDRTRSMFIADESAIGDETRVLNELRRDELERD